MEAFIEFLQPFKAATIALSREDVPTLPAVLPTLTKLDKHLTPSETDSTLIKKLKKEVKPNLGKRYLHQEPVEAVPALGACKGWVTNSAPAACKGWVATSGVPGP